MSDWVWLNTQAIDAIHEEQIAEHGGLAGLRDAGLLSSALARPRHLAQYESPDIAALAACHGFGIARNHPFADGNKRTAFVAMELFLVLNGKKLDASDQDCVLTMLALASGDLTEEQFAHWIRARLRD